jgi:hypothetical protein
MAEGAQRPPIWAAGRQAPSFQPMAFAEAGMLLAREGADAALLWLSSEASALSARVERQDWTPVARRLGRIARALPQAPAVASGLDGLAQRAGAARRLLYGLEPDLPAANPAPAPAAAPVAKSVAGPRAEPIAAAQPAAASGTPADPELAAIRALLRAAPEPARMEPRRPAPTTLAEPAAPSPRRRTLPAGLTAALDWTAVRVLAGTVLAFATPAGYVRALYRHLDGADLREFVADCHRNGIN